MALVELQLRKERVLEEINQYLGRFDNHDEKLSLQLEFAFFKLDVVYLEIALTNTTDEEEREEISQQIDWKKQFETKVHHIILLFLPQEGDY
jgi:hypothetical protein